MLRCGVPGGDGGAEGGDDGPGAPCSGEGEG